MPLSRYCATNLERYLFSKLLNRSDRAFSYTLHSEETFNAVAKNPLAKTYWSKTVVSVLYYEADKIAEKFWPQTLGKTWVDFGRSLVSSPLNRKFATLQKLGRLGSIRSFEGYSDMFRADGYGCRSISKRVPLLF
tara:strand:- start:83 stop:487 length:405 start_codon:yes stop_codon:yes gene_type:complete